MVIRVIKIIYTIFVFILICQLLVSCKPAETKSSSIAVGPGLKNSYNIVGKDIINGDNISISVPKPKSLNKGNNGIWIGPKWIREDKASIDRLLKHLGEMAINGLYLNLGEIKPLEIFKNNDQADSYQFEVYFNGFNITDEKGVFPRDDYKMLRNFTSTIKNFNKNNNSNFKIIGVINGNEKYDLLNNRDENKTDSLITTVKTTINFFNSDRLQIKKERMFDGFQLDIEPINGGNTEFLKLLREIKNILPENQTLSIVISQIGSENDLYICSDSYIKDSIASILRPGDEIALMAYDLGLNLEDYKDHIATQAYILTKSISSMNIDSSIYIPLYPESDKKIHHSSDIENIENALTGLLLSPELERVTDDFSRVIIYNYDELYGTKEWIKGFDDFKNLWIND